MIYRLELLSGSVYVLQCILHVWFLKTLILFDTKCINSIQVWYFSSVILQRPCMFLWWLVPLHWLSIVIVATFWMCMHTLLPCTQQNYKDNKNCKQILKYRKDLLFKLQYIKRRVYTLWISKSVYYAITISIDYENGECSSVVNAFIGSSWFIIR